MQTCDSKERLSSLRKLYLRLEKLLRTCNPAAEGREISIKILLAEAIARLGPSHEFSIGDLCALAKTCLPEAIYQAIPRAEEIHWTKQESQLVFDELRKNRSLLAEFDERIYGYFYQFSCAEERIDALKRIQSADKKSSVEDLISFTQLYTPDWVADYLLENTILPQWEGKLDSEFATRLNADKSAESRRSAAALTVLDPACGAGHILLRAFDLLLKMHLQENRSVSEAVRLILSDNLHGCDLDLRALWICGFSLLVKALSLSRIDFDFKLNLEDASAHKTLAGAREHFEPGSLCREWQIGKLLSAQYDAVVANPPYIGRRLMDRRLKKFLKDEYTNAHHDLSAAFLVRALELAGNAGRVGFITQSSLLYLPSYAELRKKFIDDGSVASVIELGTHVFPLVAGEKINSMLIILSAAPQSASLYLDLTRSAQKDLQLKQACAQPLPSSGFIERTSKDFLANRGAAFNYKCPSVLGDIIMQCKKLSDFAEIKQGLATSDNKRFVRYWWDVNEAELGIRWHPYVKGAGSERWLASCPTVVDWQDDGRAIKEAVEINYPYLKGRTAWVVKNEQYYFRRGMTFSFVTTGNFSVRRMSAGAIFDVGGSALFCSNDDESFLLAYLNSSFAAACAQLLNPTVNFQVGDIKQIPVPDFSHAEKLRLADLANEACALKSVLSEFDETGFAYKECAEIHSTLCGEDPEKLWRKVSATQARTIEKLNEIESELDALILRSLKNHYSLSKPEQDQIISFVSERHRERKYAEAVFADSAEFAKAILRTFVKKNFGDHPFVLINPEVPLASLQNWLEKQLEMPLRQYLSLHFNRDQEKTFLGCPQLLLYKESESGNFVCLSSSLLRRARAASAVLTGAQGSARDSMGVDGSAKNAFNMAQRLAKTLAPIDNWTGKDFYAALSNQSGF